jgi:hypothetical protein
MRTDAAGRAWRLAMDRDSLADLPADSRREIIVEVCVLLDVEAVTAEDLVRSAEPLWDAIERARGSSTLGAMPLSLV